MRGTMSVRKHRGGLIAAEPLHQKMFRYNDNRYSIWLNMRQRCNNTHNPRYSTYGKRGIKILWNSFDDFCRDMGERPSMNHTIDRIDNNGNYEPSNCRWLTWQENRARPKYKKFKEMGPYLRVAVLSALGLQRCCSCAYVKSFNLFSRDKSTFRGYARRCKQCFSKKIPLAKAGKVC